MTSRDLVQRALAGQPVPRPALGPLAVHFCAAFLGVPLETYTRDPHALAQCVIRYWERFQPDAVWVSADTWVTAEAMGAAVAFPGPGQPLAGLGSPRITSPADLERLPAPDPSSLGRWPLMIEALREIRAALGPDVFIVACFDQYPFSLACALLGLSQAMVLALEHPAFLVDVMRQAQNFVTAYASALAHAGADLLSGGDSPAGLLSPMLYRNLALPFEKSVIQNLAAAHHLPVSLHICGNTSSILPDMARSGADVLELDHQVDVLAAARIAGPGTAIWGNLDPVGLLAQASPSEVRTTTQSLIQSFASAHHSRYVVSSGCTLAPNTPHENLDALRTTVHA